MKAYSTLLTLGVLGNFAAAAEGITPPSPIKAAQSGDKVLIPSLKLTPPISPIKPKHAAKPQPIKSRTRSCSDLSPTYPALSTSPILSALAIEHAKRPKSNSAD